MQRYFDVVQNRQGIAVVGATVTVYDANGNLATLYSNNSGAASSNPVYTNSDGEYAFYAANGTYSITIALAGYATETKPGVVLFDPSDSGASNNVQFLQAGTGAQVRSVQSKLRDVVSVKDFGAVGDGVADDATAFQATRAAAGFLGAGITIPAGNYLNGNPSGEVGKNILWRYDNGGNSDNVLLLNGSRGGLFADWDCQAASMLIGQFATTQNTITNGSFRDLLFLDVLDTDTTNYTALGQTVTNGIRCFTQGAHNGSSFVAQYKDLVGSYFAASGNIQWELRGVSAITADAYQYGTGIASNEFAVNNPSAAGGSASQSKSMAAVQAIVRSRYANEDATHISRGLYITNNGLRITNGIEILSDTSEGFLSHFKNGINLTNATVSNAAIIMPLSASGNNGTIIEYDANDYTFFDRANNRFGWVVSGADKFFVGATGVGVNAAPAAGTRLFIDSSTASQSHLQLSPGTTPTAPNNGELWFDGTNVKIQVGGVTKTFTLT